MGAENEGWVVRIPRVDRSRVRVPLPGIRYFDTVTEEALIARDILGDLGGESAARRQRERDD
jgi:hypothetical protein